MTSPELQFLADWCRDPLQAPWNPALDVEALLRIAAANRILPLLGRDLPAAAPEKAANACDLAYADTLRRNRELQDLAQRVVAALQIAGITALPLRGPVMAGRIYGDPALRPSHDIDLLVPHAEIDAAHSLLLAQGLASWDSPMPPRYFTDFHFHLPYRLEPSGTRLDLHWAVDHPLLPHAIRYDAVFAAAAETPETGYPHKTLARLDEFVFCLVHAYKHAWFLPGLLRPGLSLAGGAQRERLLAAILESRTLILFRDLREFLRARGPSLLPALARRVEEWAVGRECWYALKAAQVLFDDPPPEFLAEHSAWSALGAWERRFYGLVTPREDGGAGFSGGLTSLRAGGGFRWIRLLDLQRMILARRGKGPAAALHFLRHGAALAWFNLRRLGKERGR